MDRFVNEAVKKTNSDKWKKLNDFGKKALLTGVSMLALLGGGTVNINAQRVVEVPADQLDAYLKGQTSTPQQDQYAQIYANRDAYRQSRQTARAQGVSLEEGGYVLNNNGHYYTRDEYYSYGAHSQPGRPPIVGVYRDTENPDLYVIVTDHNGVLKTENTSSYNLDQMLPTESRRGMGIYDNLPPTGRRYHNVYYPSNYNSTAGNVHDVLNVIDHAAHTVDHILHTVRGGRGR